MKSGMKRGTLINHRVLAVIENEWAQMIRNRVVMLTTFAPPFLFVLLALLVLYLSSWIDVNYTVVKRINAALSANLNPSAPLTLTSTDAVRAALLNPFLVLFEILPLVVPLTIASYSIIGEKQNRSLEAILATPIRTWELLLAKVLAASIPGVGATWYSFAIFVFVARFTTSPVLYHNLILSPTWLTTITILTPLFTMFAVSLGIIISSRVKDPQGAQQVGSLIVLPLLGVMVGQIVGAVNINLNWILSAALVLGFLDAALMVLAVRLFQREKILTGWK